MGGPCMATQRMVLASARYLITDALINLFRREESMCDAVLDGPSHRQPIDPKIIGTGTTLSYPLTDRGPHPLYDVTTIISIVTCLFYFYLFSCLTTVLFQSHVGPRNACRQIVIVVATF